MTRYDIDNEEAADSRSFATFTLVRLLRSLPDGGRGFAVSLVMFCPEVLPSIRLVFIKNTSRSSFSSSSSSFLVILSSYSSFSSSSSSSFFILYLLLIHLSLPLLLSLC